MPHCYFVSFSGKGPGGYFTSWDTFALDKPLEYGGDLRGLIDKIAERFQCNGVVLHGWQPIKAGERPADAACAETVVAQPDDGIGWLWSLHVEPGHIRQCLTLDGDQDGNPFGRPGRDYSERSVVTRSRVHLSSAIEQVVTQ